MKITTLRAISLIIFWLLASFTVARGQGRSVTNPDGSTTTTARSNEFGEGGSVETDSDKNFKVIGRRYYDKCGRLRQVDLPHGHAYYSPDRSGEILEYPGDKGGMDYLHYSSVSHKQSHLHPDYGKELIEKWKNEPIPPCPEPEQKTTDHPEKPKENPNPLKLLEGLNIGIGVSGGHTFGHDNHRGGHHVTDQKRGTSTTPSKKTVTSMCVCHPCTCSPCRCH